MSERPAWPLLALGLIALAVLLTLPALAQWSGDPAWISLFTRMLIYALAAVSLNLVLGYGGMACFGHAAFFGIGGYTVAVLFKHFQLGIDPGDDQPADHSARGDARGRAPGIGHRCAFASYDRRPVPDDHARLRANAVLPFFVAFPLRRQRWHDRATT
jgi:ABC-type branched-subunit amino acid transport system permease subunit